MTTTKVSKLTENEAKVRLNALIYIDEYFDECKTCRLPELLYRGNACSRGNHAGMEEECRIWKEYRVMIKPMVVYLKRRKSTENEQSQLTRGVQDLIDLMERKWTKEEKEIPLVKYSGMARVVKPAKVPS